MIKIYDKSLQFGLPYELLRFELHFNKMADLRKYGIITLNDLKNQSKLGNLKTELLTRFDEVFIYDWTINEVMIKRKPKDFYKWSLPHYWVDELNKKNRLKRKAVYTSFISEYSNDIKTEIRNLISTKMNELINEKGDHFTVESKNTKSDLLTV